MREAKKANLLKPGLHISHKDRKHMFANMYFKLSRWLALHVVVMITIIDHSQETFAISIR